ncbi:MAG: hypothetical protein JSW71_06980, partial [Gemmatimonadota bacterium]
TLSGIGASSSGGHAEQRASGDSFAAALEATVQAYAETYARELGFELTHRVTERQTGVIPHLLRYKLFYGIAFLILFVVFFDPVHHWAIDHGWGHILDPIDRVLDMIWGGSKDS